MTFSSELYFPTAQCSQSAGLIPADVEDFAYFPTGHEVHLDEPGVEYVPASQSTHADEFVADNSADFFPPVHLVQMSDFCPEAVPALEKVPSGHSTHEVEPWAT